MDIFKKNIKEVVRILLDFILVLIFFFKPALNNEDFLLITGSDSSHFNSLVNLLNSLKKYEKKMEVVIINLGLTKDEINFLKENFIYPIKDFDFVNSPDFVSCRDKYNKLGSYAWKPISIFKEFNSTSKNILWLDAGCLINKKLSLIKSIIRKNGFYSPQSSDDIEKWTHEKTLRLLNASDSILKKRNISGGIVGFAKNSVKISQLLEEWYLNSIDKDIIAPEGSSRINHRQDQAILSVLLHKFELSNLTPRTHKIFGILKHQDDEKDNYLQ